MYPAKFTCPYGGKLKAVSSRNFGFHAIGLPHPQQL
jgi:hypothetical protein